MLIKHYLPALIRKQKLLFCTMALMFAVTFSMFAGSSYALDNYKISIEKFFNDCKYPGAFIATELTSSASFDCLQSLEGVNDYDIRFSSVFDFQVNSDYCHVQLNTYKEDDFSGFATISESVETKNLPLSVDQQFADKRDLEVGDIVFLGKDGNFCTCTISRIVLHPENLNFRVLGDVSTDNINYGVVYLDHSNLDSLLKTLQIDTFGLDSNQALIDIDPNFDKNEVLDDCRAALSENVSIISSYTDDDSPSMVFRNELTNQFTALSSTGPFVQLAIVCVISVLFLMQIVKRQSREIGILLACGYQKTSVYALFAAYVFSMCIVSIVVGIVFSFGIGNITYGLYQNGVHLPLWTETIALDKMLLSGLIIIVAGQFACSLSALTFSRSSPMDALGKIYQDGIKLGERIEVLLYGIPTAVRLALNTIIQNLRNFFVIVFGFIASFVMIYSAFSMYFSLKEYVGFTYDHQNNYDAQVISLKEDREDPFYELRGSDNVEKMQDYRFARVDIVHDGKTRNVALQNFPEDCDMLRFKDASSGKSIAVPEKGIIIDEITAEDLDIQQGDMVEIHDRELEVVAVAAMYSEQFEVVSPSQWEKLDIDGSKGTLVNVSDDDKLRELCAFSEANLCPVFASDLKNMELDFKTSISALTDLVVIVAVLLGFIVVCTVNAMTLEKTKRIISILRLQGMQVTDISRYWALQMTLQLVLAFAAGFPLAHFAGKSFIKMLCSDISYYPYIGDFSIYALSFAFIILFSFASHLVVISTISRFNLAQNVQSRE